jgi:hypothetical protein
MPSIRDVALITISFQRSGLESGSSSHQTLSGLCHATKTNALPSVPFDHLSTRKVSTA